MKFYATVVFEQFEQPDGRVSAIEVYVPARYYLKGVLWRDVKSKIVQYCRRFAGENYTDVVQLPTEIRINFRVGTQERVTITGIQSIARIAHDAIAEAENQVEVVRAAINAEERER